VCIQTKWPSPLLPLDLEDNVVLEGERRSNSPEKISFVLTGKNPKEDHFRPSLPETSMRSSESMDKGCMEMSDVPRVEDKIWGCCYLCVSMCASVQVHT